MKARRHTPEQVIRELREAEKLLGEGKQIGKACKALEISEPTFHRLRNQYGGMKADDVVPLRKRRARVMGSLGGGSFPPGLARQWRSPGSS